MKTTDLADKLGWKDKKLPDVSLDDLKKAGINKKILQDWIEHYKGLPTKGPKIADRIKQMEKLLEKFK